MLCSCYKTSWNWKILRQPEVLRSYVRFGWTVGNEDNFKALFQIRKQFFGLNMFLSNYIQVLTNVCAQTSAKRFLWPLTPTLCNLKSRTSIRLNRSNFAINLVYSILQTMLLLYVLASWGSERGKLSAWCVWVSWLFLVDVFSSRSLSSGRSCCIGVLHGFHHSGVSAWVFLQNLGSSVSDPSGIKLTIKNTEYRYLHVYVCHMNVVAAYHTQKHHCSCWIQPFLCAALLALALRNHESDPPGSSVIVTIFSAGRGGNLVLFLGFLVFGVSISKLPFVSLTTSRSLSETRVSVSNTAPGSGCSQPPALTMKSSRWAIQFGSLFCPVCPGAHSQGAGRLSVWLLGSALYPAWPLERFPLPPLSLSE